MIAFFQPDPDYIKRGEERRGGGGRGLLKEACVHDGTTPTHQGKFDDVCDVGHFNSRKWFNDFKKILFQ